MRNRLRPDSSDEYFDLVWDIHDIACTPHCNLGITWSWYDDIVDLHVNHNLSREEIIHIYTNEAA